MRKICSLISLFVLAWCTSVLAETPPVLKSELAEGTVTVVFPASSFEVGDQKPFKVRVEPAPGKAAPNRVRGRFGMPYMGHWVTDEQSHTYAGDGMEFKSNIAMNGVYRFRIWLDYSDGSGAKTAVDFKVMADEGIDAKVVNE